MKPVFITIISIALCFANTSTRGQSKGVGKDESTAIRYGSTMIEGVRVFYREAGDPRKPAILMLHGFPSSSHMFREVMQLLASEFHLVAPDYPGFGQSEAPDAAVFNYSFDNLAAVVRGLIGQLKLKGFYLYVHDYGGPVGFRIASQNPSLVKGLIIQNANAYPEGWGPAAADLQRYIDDPTEKNAADISMFLTLAGTKFQYFAGADTTKINPDSYSLDQYYLDRKGNSAIQYALFRDYKSNILLYPEWQRYFQNTQPRTLVLWGKNDPIFTEAGARAYKKHLPAAEVVLMDGGHFLIAEKPQEIAGRIRKFVNSR